MEKRSDDDDENLGEWKMSHGNHKKTLLSLSPSPSPLSLFLFRLSSLTAIRLTTKFREFEIDQNKKYTKINSKHI